MFRLHSRVLQHPRLATPHERFQPIALDIGLGFEPEILLYLDLHPEALAVEAVLVAEFPASHRPVAIVDVFVGATPAVVYAHGVVGSDGAIDEGPGGRSFAQLAQLVKGVRFFPKIEHLMFLFYEIDVRGHVFEWHDSSPNRFFIASSMLVVK